MPRLDARRTWLLVVLLGLYLASGLRPVIGGLVHRGSFDPFLPAARALEQRIADRRFAEALPLATDLDRAFPREPQITLWLARVHHGLNDPTREVVAWQRYVDIGVAPEDACPSLPRALAQAGRPAESLAAYERCAAFDPNDTVRLIDLGDAYLLANRMPEALAQYERASRIDPRDPNLAARMASVPGPHGDAQ